jgi:sulfate permease, SulP family
VKSRFLHQYLPFTDWLLRYDRRHLSGDITAGVVVAIMLVPQSMAYAMLAGLPPEVGLYASIVPLILYALLGSSRFIATGPVAMVSLMVLSGLSALAVPGSPEYVGLALTLALMIGAMQVLMGLLRLGFLVNFLSHPVVSGFTSAAALVIGLSQLKHLLGVRMDESPYPWQLALEVFRALPDTNWLALAIGVPAILVLLGFRYLLPGVLKALRLPESVVTPISRTGPLAIVVLGTLAVFAFGWGERIAIVGEIPQGLPPLTLPGMGPELLATLAPIAIAIVFVSYMEHVSVAQALAAKRRQKIDANQELFALGASNLGAAFTGGYPVTGGFSRSGVNFTAGANTGLASLITAGLVALTVLYLTPLFEFLPRAVLAAIIVVAVASLFDLKTLRLTLRYNRVDAAALLVTFGAVLGLGITTGLIVGIAASLAMYLWRTSRPHIAVVGRVDDSEHFRNVKRHKVVTYPGILLVRVDESLYFANTRFLESALLQLVAEQPDVRHVVLICSAVNQIDASALESLESLIQKLKDAGATLHLAEVKGPVMDRLWRVDFPEHLAPGQVYLSTHEAIQTLQQDQPAEA